MAVLLPRNHRSPLGHGPLHVPEDVEFVVERYGDLVHGPLHAAGIRPIASRREHRVEDLMGFLDHPGLVGGSGDETAHRIEVMGIDDERVVHCSTVTVSRPPGSRVTQKTISPSRSFP